MAKQFNIKIFTDNLMVGNNGYITYHKVNNINKFIVFADGKFPAWKFLVVFDHSTKKEVDFIKKSNL